MHPLHNRQVVCNINCISHAYGSSKAIKDIWRDNFRLKSRLSQKKRKRQWMLKEVKPSKHCTWLLKTVLKSETQKNKNILDMIFFLGTGNVYIDSIFIQYLFQEIFTFITSTSISFKRDVNASACKCDCWASHPEH